MKKKSSDSRRMSNRRSRRGSRRGKSGGVKRKIVKTRRMRGGGKKCTNEEFTEKDGKVGYYTGNAVEKRDQPLSRSDKNAIMDYVNGEKYVGAFVQNMKHGKGTMYYDGGDGDIISLSGQWWEDKPIKIHTKRTYKKDGKLITSYVNPNQPDQPDIDPELRLAADETIKFQTERPTPTPTPSPPTPSLQTPTPIPPTQSILLSPPPKSRITRDMRLKPLEMNDT